MEIFQNLFHELLGLIGTNPQTEIGIWKYLILAFLVAVEGPAATLLGAAAAGIGVMQVKFVFLFASMGNLTADTIWYSLGYAGKQAWLLRVGRWLGIRNREFQRLRSKMHHYAPRILLVAKITSGLVIPSLVAAGLVRVPWKKWFPPVAIGELIWTGSLVFIGFHAANLVKFVEKDVQWFVFGSTLIFLLVLVVLIRRAFQRRALLDRVENFESEDQEPIG